MLYLHAAMLFARYDYAFNDETSALVFVVTPLVGVVGALLVCGWESDW